jgi:hypothetical protein
MDSKMIDESNNRRREEALARRLGDALDLTATGGTEPCPDAELIAAYHERELGPESVTQCEVHFAACSRCRKILAVLAATPDAPLAETEVARLGELVAAAGAPRMAAPQAAMPARPNLLHWRARWLAPALGVAAVLAVWFAMRPPWRTTDQGSSGTLIAQAPKSESLPPSARPAVDQFSSAAPVNKSVPDAATRSTNLKDQSADKSEPAASSMAGLTRNSLDDTRATDKPAPRAKAAESAPADQKKERAEVNRAVAAAPAPAPPPPPPPASLPSQLAQAQANAAGPAAPAAPEAVGSLSQSVTVSGGGPTVNTTTGAAPEVPRSTSQTVMVTGAAPLVDTTNGALGGLVNEQKTSDLPLNGRDYTDLASLNANAENSVLIKSPSGKILWNAGKGGRIERSTDAGKTWRAQTSPLRDDWLAGAAESDTVCWLAGRNGAIAQTTNGKRWKRITSPTQAAVSGKLPDWIDVRASSAQAATITASDQRRFATQDGGKTWQSQ